MIREGKGGYKGIGNGRRDKGREKEVEKKGTRVKTSWNTVNTFLLLSYGHCLSHFSCSISYITFWPDNW